MDAKEGNAMFIVVFDDEAGIIIPMSWDANCEGALCASNCGSIALFDTKAEARAAITISRKFSELQKAQGKPTNTDFTENRKFVEIRAAAKQDE